MKFPKTIFLLVGFSVTLASIAFALYLPISIHIFFFNLWWFFYIPILFVAFKKKIFRKSLLYWVGVFLAYFIVGAYLILGPEVSDYLSRRSFISEEWKKGDSLSHPIRLKMIHDLLKHHHLIGMTRREIIALLGEPPKTGYFQTHDFVYWLGPETGPFGMDSQWLCIKFENDVVTKYDLLTD